MTDERTKKRALAKARDVRVSRHKEIIDAKVNDIVDQLRRAGVNDMMGGTIKISYVNKEFNASIIIEYVVVDGRVLPQVTYPVI